MTVRTINAITMVSNIEEMCYNGSMHKRIGYEGFTLIELSLSLAFISILSIAVVLVVSGSISTYHKGLVLNKINSVGVEVVDDMRNAVQGSPASMLKSRCYSAYDAGNTTAIDKCVSDNARNFTAVARYASVRIGNREEDNVPVFGAFCTGAYSYVWNSGYFFNDSDYKVENGGLGAASLAYTLIEGGSSKQVTASDFRLLKVKDNSRSVCVSAVVGDGARYDLSNNSIESGFTLENLLDEKPIDLLESSSGLALYSLSSSPSEQMGSNKSIFYYTSFILGTVQGGINVMSNGNFCATTDGYNDSVENFDYCAINKFNFAALATGG